MLDDFFIRPRPRVFTEIPPGDRSVGPTEVDGGIEPIRVHGRDGHVFERDVVHVLRLKRGYVTVQCPSFGIEHAHGTVRRARNEV